MSPGAQQWISAQRTPRTGWSGRARSREGCFMPEQHTLNWTEVKWIGLMWMWVLRAGGHKHTHTQTHTHPHTHRKLPLFSWMSPLPCQGIWSIGFLSRSQLSRTELREWEEGEEGKEGGTEGERESEREGSEREKYSHSHGQRRREWEEWHHFSQPLSPSPRHLCSTSRRGRRACTRFPLCPSPLIRRGEKKRKEQKGAGPANRRG